MTEQVYIFDTTLRDGEQSPGCMMDEETKLRMAKQLEKLGVDIIEAGFPIASPGESEAVQRICQEVREPIIAALARTRPEDIEAAAEAIADAARPRIHTFVSTSDVHVTDKLRKSPREVVAMAVEAVKHAREYCEDVEFSPEDAARTGKDYLAEIVEKTIAAGAITVNIPDTVGYSNPWEFGELIVFLFRTVRGIDQVVVSVHCHNDLDMAVANSLAGVRAGARQVECCVMGIGERAGNAQLEPLVMSLKIREDFFGFEVGVNTPELGPTARLLSSLIGKPIADNVPVIGANALKHGSGVHQHGVIQNPVTYEIMKAKDIGWQGETFALTKHSGKAALAERLSSLGYEFDDLALSAIYEKFIELADLKTEVYDDGLHMLAQEYLIHQRVEAESLFDLPVDKVMYSRSGEIIEAFVEIHRNGEIREASGTGDGSVAAVFTAINKAVSYHKVELPSLKLDDYTVIKGRGGPEAVGWAVVHLRSNGRVGYGRSGHTDVVVASALAYIYAINHLMQVPVEQVATEAI